MEDFTRCEEILWIDRNYKIIKLCECQSENDENIFSGTHITTTCLDCEDYPYETINFSNESIDEALYRLKKEAASKGYSYRINPWN